MSAWTLSAFLAAAGCGAAPAMASGGPGSLLAWGANTAGQLGDNAAEPQANVPVAVSAGAIPPGTKIIQIAAGASHSLALSSTGQVYAWGSNTQGQLGDNAHEPQANVPVAASAGAIPPGTKIIEVAAGVSYSLALSSVGQVYAWGDNTSGQLGDTPTGPPAQANVPVAVSPGAIPTGTKIIQIAAGAAHSLAISSTGQLYAWGFNDVGQLGDTPSGLPADANVPVAVSPGAIPSGTTFTQIAAGGFHSLALSSTGKLYTWGENNLGQLGAGGVESEDNVPVAVLMPAGTTFTQIAAGNYHSLALSSTNRLYAWGGNAYGELGDNAAEAHAPVPVAVSAGAIPAGTTFIQIAASSIDSLALSSTGRVYAWGYNAQGQLGNTPSGTPTQANVPVAVSLPAGTTIDAIARGPMANHGLSLIGDLAVRTAVLPAGEVGALYSAAVSAAGGIGPYTWAARGLPRGLSINPTSGRLSGTPRASGTSSVSVSVSDADGLIAARTLALKIRAPNSQFKTRHVRVNHKTGAITFTERVSDPGAFHWVLTLGKGRTVRFGKGRKSVATAGTVSFTVEPSRSAKKALQNALKKHRGVRITASLTFRSARGGKPVSHTKTISDRLT